MIFDFKSRFLSEDILNFMLCKNLRKFQKILPFQNPRLSSFSFSQQNNAQDTVPPTDDKSRRTIYDLKVAHEYVTSNIKYWLL